METTMSMGLRAAKTKSDRKRHAAEVIAKERLPVVGRGATSTRDHVVGDGSLSETCELVTLASREVESQMWMNEVHRKEFNELIAEVSPTSGFEDLAAIPAVHGRLRGTIKDPNKVEQSKLREIGNSGSGRAVEIANRVGYG